MKKILFCILALLLCFSYQLQAQCPVIAPDADEWIEKNQEKIKTLTRAEWQELQEGYKWIVFTKLSPQQCHEFFRLKIEQVRDNFEWNKTEKAHLDNLYQFFIDNPDLYDKENNDEEKEAYTMDFLNNWFTYALDELKWSPKLIQAVGMTAADLLDKEGNVRVTSEINIDFKQFTPAE